MGAMPIDMQYLMIAFTAKIEYFYYCFVNEQMPSFSEHDIFVFSGVFISIFSCPVLGFFGKMVVMILTGLKPCLK